MSRSYKKSPYHAWTSARSEKSDKQIANRRYRRAVKRAIQRGDELMPHMREVSNVFLWSKDGKVRWSRLEWEKAILEFYLGQRSWCPQPWYKIYGK